MFKLTNKISLPVRSSFNLLQINHVRCLCGNVLNNRLQIPRNNERRYLSNFILKDIHEPSYLDYLKPQTPYYDLVNVQIKGYDYAVLESYGSYLHRLCCKLGLNVNKYWCAPNTTKKVETLKSESNVIEHTYTIDVYERNIQLEKVSASLMSLVVDIVHRSLPSGVYLSIHNHDHHLHEYSRYIPDHQLADYKSELKALLASKRKEEEELNK